MKNYFNETDFYRKLTVLYVEDDPEIRRTVESIMNKIFKELYVADDGEEALEIYSRLKKDKKHLDAIISDINMPKVNGIELLERVREDNYDMPFIFTTAYSETDYLFDSIKKNATDYMLKPVDIGLLIEKIGDASYLARQRETIKKQKKELERYLRAIDNVAIISKTDLKGNITFANEIFCEISQYSKNELYGRSHNIIRHNDVPAETYKELWKTIQSGHTWQGKVKNKAKDGSSYFVNATIIPLYDEVGDDISEYIGIRFLTTDDEVEKREFKKKVMQNFQDMRKKHFEDSDYIEKLEKKLKEYEHYDLLEEALEKERKKSSKLHFQVKYYEKELKEAQEKNLRLIDLSNEKINEVSKKTKQLNAQNNKLKIEVNTLSLENEKSKKKIVLLEEKIKQLEQKDIKRDERISQLEEMVTFREEQIKNLKY